MRQQIILSCQSNNPVFCVNAQMQEQRFYRLVWSKVSYRGIYGGCIAEFLCAQIAMLEGIVEYGGGNPEFRPSILGSGISRLLSKASITRYFSTGLRCKAFEIMVFVGDIFLLFYSSTLLDMSKL